MKPYLILHHSGDPQKEPQASKIDGYHKARGFPLSALGYYIGYHFVGEREGTVIQARLPAEVGAHTDAMCDGGHCNLVGIGYCLAGDFRTEEPTEQQLKSLYDTWKALKYPTIIYHSEVKDTSCPGSFDFRRAMRRLKLSDLRQRLKNAVNATGRFLADSIRGRKLRREIPRLEEEIRRQEIELYQP